MASATAAWRLSSGSQQSRVDKELNDLVLSRGAEIGGVIVKGSTVGNSVGDQLITQTLNRLKGRKHNPQRTDELARPAKMGASASSWKVTTEIEPCNPQALREWRSHHPPRKFDCASVEALVDRLAAPRRIEPGPAASPVVLEAPRSLKSAEVDALCARLATPRQVERKPTSGEKLMSDVEKTSVRCVNLQHLHMLSSPRRPGASCTAWGVRTSEQEAVHLAMRGMKKGCTFSLKSINTSATTLPKTDAGDLEHFSQIGSDTDEALDCDDVPGGRSPVDSGRVVNSARVSGHNDLVENVGSSSSSSARRPLKSGGMQGKDSLGLGPSSHTSDDQGQSHTQAKAQTRAKAQSQVPGQAEARVQAGTERLAEAQHQPQGPAQGHAKANAQAKVPMSQARPVVQPLAEAQVAAKPPAKSPLQGRHNADAQAQVEEQLHSQSQAHTQPNSKTQVKAQAATDSTAHPLRETQTQPQVQAQTRPTGAQAQAETPPRAQVQGKAQSKAKAIVPSWMDADSHVGIQAQAQPKTNVQPQSHAQTREEDSESLAQAQAQLQVEAKDHEKAKVQSKAQAQADARAQLHEEGRVDKGGLAGRQGIAGSRNQSSNNSKEFPEERPKASIDPPQKHGVLHVNRAEVDDDDIREQSKRNIKSSSDTKDAKDARFGSVDPTPPADEEEEEEEEEGYLDESFDSEEIDEDTGDSEEV